MYVELNFFLNQSVKLTNKREEGLTFPQFIYLIFEVAIFFFQLL